MFCVNARGMGVLEWQDILGGPAPLLVTTGQSAVRTEITRVLLLEKGPGEEEASGSLVVAAATSPLLDRTRVAALSTAAGVVVCGDRTVAERAAEVLPVPVMLPAAGGDTAEVYRGLLECAAAVGAARLRRAEMLLALAAAAPGGDGLEDLLDWCRTELGWRVRVVAPADAVTESGGDAAEMSALVGGRIRGPVPVPDAMAAAVGRHVPRPVLLAARSDPGDWTAQDVLVLEQVAAVAATVVWAAGVSTREAGLRLAAADLRATGLRQLMAGDLALAARTVEPLAPGLVVAGAGRVAVLECGGRADSREALSASVKQALSGTSALVVRDRDQHRQVVVLVAAGTERLEELLGPVLAAVPGRSAGISLTTPWLRTAAAYEAALASLATARGLPGRIAMADGLGRPLLEYLSADAVIWAARLLEPLENLPDRERERLLAMARQTLWWGDTAGARLMEVSRQTLGRRLDALAGHVGLDRREPWHRVALYLAVRLSSKPLPAEVDRPITLEGVLDHRGAREWALDALAPLADMDRTREILAAYVRCGMSAKDTMKAASISRTTLYEHLNRAATATGLEVARYPGPAYEMALALYVAGDIGMGSLPDLSARHSGGPRAWGGPVDDVAGTHTDKPHAGRMLDYYLGGVDNYDVDRVAAERMLNVNRGLVISAQTNRSFVERTVRFLSDRGVDQFLDLGSGIPTATERYPNLHGAAQGENPASRVVYLDNDPIVAAHAARKLVSTPEGAVAFVLDDLRRGAELYKHPEITAVLDFTRPVTVFLGAVLHFFASDDEARALVNSLAGGLRPGSYLGGSHITRDWNPEVMDALVRMYRHGVTGGGTRSQADIEALMTGAGLELVEPGVVCLPDWRPEPGDLRADPAQVNLYGWLARVPERS